MRPDEDHLRIAAVDDHPALLRGIAAEVADVAPEIKMAALAASVSELLNTLDEAVDVLLLDLELRQEDDNDVARNIERLASIADTILIYTSHEYPVLLQQAVSAGARGLLLKIDPLETIVSAIRACRAGDVVCSSPLAAALLDGRGAVRLTSRQVEVIRLLALGFTHAEIGRQLHIAEGTVQEYLKRAFAIYREAERHVPNGISLVRQARIDGYLPDL